MKKLILLAAFTLCYGALHAQPQLRPDNIGQVIQAMTLEEKAALLVGVSPDNLVPGTAGGTRAIPRLGIPQTVFSDGPAGVRIDPDRDPKHTVATGFPVGTLLASSWDTALMEETTAVMGNEVLEYGVDVLLAPGMNIHRNPLCGRNFEYFSEDPVLSGKMAAAYVRGIQRNGVGTSIKHFAANSQETNRTENDARISKRALREIYLKNYEIAVKESDPWTVMSSYNKLNGTYTQQHADLLTTILRDEWGYKGIVITDWGVKDNTVAAVKAGNDLMDPGVDEEVQRILEGVKDGLVSQEELDRNVRRILEYVVKTPHFRRYAHSSHPDLKAHAVTAREAAAQSIVLLRNQRHTLPLKGTEKVALYGVTAEDFVAGGTGSGEVTKPYVVTMTEALESAGFTLDAPLRRFYQAQKEVQYAGYAMEYVEDGGRRAKDVSIDPDILRYQARNNDVAVYVLGRNAGEGRDRHVEDDFELTAAERDLIRNLSEAYHGVGKRVVVVLNIGGVIETASWKYLVDAIVLPWSPGQEGANAVADVLTGKVNPSGKLPMTFPNLYKEIPSSANFPYDYDVDALYYPEKNFAHTLYTEDIWVGYRYFQTQEMEVSYPFGFGLSYTTFAYSKPVVKAGPDGFTASVTVTNTGDVPGREAVQLYVAAPSGGLQKPARELKAFGKTRELRPGESQTLSFSVSAYELASFNENTSAWETAEGDYDVLFGASVEDIRARGAYRQKKAVRYPVHDVMDIPGIPVYPAVDAQPAGPGLRYTYCEGAPMSVAQVAASPVKTSGIAPVFSTSYKERDDHFGLIFKGLLKIDSGGIYRLSLTSDDGSALWLDGQPLLDLDFDGGGSTDAMVKLEAGYHRLEVQFFENFAEESLRVGLEGPGLAADNISAHLLFHE